MANYGYCRVSTADQDMTLQIDALERDGVERVFQDVVSGAVDDRPGLAAMLSIVERGDKITVWRLDRLGRSLRHLSELADQLRDRGVQIRSIVDGVDTATATGRMLFGILATVSEYEREFIVERVHAGIAAAQARGIHCGRRSVMNSARTDEARRMLKSRPRREVCAILRVSDSTLRRALVKFPATS